MSSNFVNLFNQITTLVNNTANYAAQARQQNVAGQLSIFINNVHSSVAARNTQPAQPLPQANIANQQVQQNQILNQQIQESILQTQEALKEFSQADKSALIKNMLNMPEDLSQLLKLISNKNENLTNAEFMKLLSMLNVNGKEAAAKLSKLMVFLGANNIKGAEKLQEVYSIINALSSGATQNASQLMKNIILLYLPWLPIGENNNFEIGLKKTESGKESGAQDSDSEENQESDSISIFIQTVNFSNVKVTLYMEQRQNISMFVECIDEFPKAQLQEMIKGDSQKLNVMTNMNFAKTTNKNIEKNEDTDFSVNVSKFINPYLMLMAQAVIKAVIDIDKHTTLIDKRRIIG